MDESAEPHRIAVLRRLCQMLKPEGFSAKEHSCPCGAFAFCQVVKELRKIGKPTMSAFDINHGGGATKEEISIFKWPL